MAGEDGLATTIQNTLDGGNGGLNATIVGDLAAIEGDVEIHADEAEFAGDIHAGDVFLGHDPPLKGLDGIEGADAASPACVVHAGKSGWI